ncbi:hypothetical protein BT63DRAFT_369026 [Microthyrium microscopicum]|uniref:Potassium transport protein n=1 Tax=Microthyrium microscopicum TaxID=703497 RepID=A0A6A6UQT0_9PEZI|nr:hypothetical protein BT63DRAFT_369026 [Microthyrium microscopicum]
MWKRTKRRGNNLEDNVESRLPLWLQWRLLKSFNFILFHYVYLILLSIIGSIILYPGGGLPYIDALFFATGAATQSGLNTVDVNKMLLYQQITVMFVACLCNPITINTFVVFVRLYWFEKRFQRLVREARLGRGRTRSMTKSMEKHSTDLDRIERGIQGRSITVLHENDKDRPLGLRRGMTDPVGTHFPAPRRPSTADHAASESPILKRDITFADEVNKPPPIPNEERVPAQRSQDHHIAFVENQRNPRDNTALRIPGPRDAERGIVPERINNSDSDEPDPLTRVGSSHTDDFDAQKKPRTTGVKNDEDDEAHPLKHRLRPHFSLPNRFRRDSSSPVSIRSRVQRVSTFLGRTLSQSKEDTDPLPYLSFSTTIARNSQFVDLSEEQREELGGIEYRSLKTLAAVLLFYNIGLSILGIIILLPWMVRSTKYSEIVRGIGQSPVWWGIFTPTSMFTDLGFTLTPDSMISFQTAWLPMLLGSFLIIIGNTGFPIMLRFVIWVASKCVPFGSGVWEELRFLMDHPRRCFTLLFPRKATWWLFSVLILLNVIDLVFFVILDLHDDAVTSLPDGYKFLDGLFQAASTRTAGFACVNLADLHPGIQVSYLIMMYISVFPIAISVRQTNVYEEKSLGIWAKPTQHDEDERDDEPITRSYIGNHLRRQLSFDLWYVFLGLFFICVIEGDRIENNSEPSFSIFSVLFEIVSAYGTVGLSLGYPNTNASFSAQFKPLSKLIIIAMMIRGRHRGLPYALDRAILLPGEGLQSDKARRASEAAAQERVQAAAREAARKPDDDERRGRARSRSSVGRFTNIISGALSAGPGIKEKHV